MKSSSDQAIIRLAIKAQDLEIIKTVIRFDLIECHEVHVQSRLKLSLLFVWSSLC